MGGACCSCCAGAHSTVLSRVCLGMRTSCFSFFLSVHVSQPAAGCLHVFCHVVALHLDASTDTVIAIRPQCVWANARCGQCRCYNLKQLFSRQPTSESGLQQAATSIR